MSSFITEYKNLIIKGINNQITPKQLGLSLYNQELQRKAKLNLPTRIDEIILTIKAIFELQNNKEFNFIETIEQGKTLFVGEGNFSFSLVIAENVKNQYNIVATTIENQDEISDFTAENITQLNKIGATVLYKIDATKLENYFRSNSFENIIFQFPNAGSREPINGRNPNFVLLNNFLKSAKLVLSQNGKAIISVVDSHYYEGIFQIEETFKNSGFSNIKCYDFNILHFENYTHQMTNRNESAIDKNDKLVTIVFEK